jgi:hypothetical protein
LRLLGLDGLRLLDVGPRGGLGRTSARAAGSAAGAAAAHRAETFAVGATATFALAETRMGSGKGSPEGWVAVVKPGRVMFELAGVPEPLAKEALRLAGSKLAIKTKIVQRDAEIFD